MSAPAYLASLIAARDAAFKAAQEQFEADQQAYVSRLNHAVSLSQAAFRGSQVRAALKVQAESLSFTGNTLSRVIDRTLSRKRGDPAPGLNDSLMELDVSPGACMAASAMRDWMPLRLFAGALPVIEPCTCPHPCRHEVSAIPPWCPPRPPPFRFTCTPHAWPQGHFAGCWIPSLAPRWRQRLRYLLRYRRFPVHQRSVLSVAAMSSHRQLQPPTSQPICLVRSLLQSAIFVTLAAVRPTHHRSLAVRSKPHWNTSPLLVQLLSSLLSTTASLRQLLVATLR